MGVELYALDRHERRALRIGAVLHEVGVVRRLWKVTATSMRAGRGERLELLADEQATGAATTPPVVLVDDESGSGTLRVLGWDAGRLTTQDLDWDHLPILGWAVVGQDGRAVLHEEVNGTLVLVDDDRARELGVIARETDRLAEQRVPTITGCRSVERLSANHYQADCTLERGREAIIVGESESGELPDRGWFSGRTTAAVARYRLVDQLGAGG